MTRPNRMPDPRSDYVGAVERTLLRVLWGRRPADVADMIQSELVRLWTKVDRIMVDYPNPVVYARVRAAHGATQWTRTDDAQAGRGARRGRTVVSGHVAVSGDDSCELFSTLAIDANDPADMVADAIDGANLLERCLIGLSDTDRTVLYLVDGHAVPVSDVAKMFHVSRETMSRRVSRLRRHVRRRAADTTGGDPGPPATRRLSPTPSPTPLTSVMT